MITGLFFIISARKATDIIIINISMIPETDDNVGLIFFNTSIVKTFRKANLIKPPRTMGITIKNPIFVIKNRNEKYDVSSKRSGSPNGMTNTAKRDVRD